MRTFEITQEIFDRIDAYYEKEWKTTFPKEDSFAEKDMEHIV